MSYRPRSILVPVDPPRVLTPIDLDELEARKTELKVDTDTCKVCHIQHERPVAFHALILDDSNSSSDAESPNIAHELQPVERNSDLDSIPELEDEVDLDTAEIPLWLIPSGVTITFRSGQVIFEREQGPPWQEVLAQMLEEQNLTSDNI